MHLRLAFGSLAALALIALGLAQGAGSTAQPIQLQYANGVFRIVSGSETTRISAQTSTETETARQPEKLLFRRDDAFVVWDARGLSVRKGDEVITTGLEYLTLSPKLFSEEEITLNFGLYFLGRRDLRAAEVVGSKRVGNSVYLLVEWTDFVGDPWLHVVVEADLTTPKPDVNVIGKIPGIALDVTDDWDRLLLTPRGLVSFVSGSGSWGRSVLDLKAKTLTFEKLGEQVVEVRKRSDNLAHYKSRTTYGSLVMGQVSLASGNALPLIETKGNVRLLDSETPWIFVEADQRGRDLHNADTGAERMIPADAGIMRTPKGLLVWSPQKNPTLAELLEMNRLEVIARWTPKAEVKPPAKPKKTSGRGRG
ncbi:MAG: hypothetical protein KF784_15375 [Fimbriimonadaceae bacterium]|nr:hypothetical protein [Fimbriimonadaceae bacterium]